MRARFSRPRSTLAAAAFFALFALAPLFAGQGVAHAQDARSTYTEQRTDSGTAVIFKEDAAHGSTLGGLGASIVVQPSAFRMGLVRPRLNFVAEMLKSVEAL